MSGRSLLVMDTTSVTINNFNWSGGTLQVPALDDPTVVPANAILKVSGTLAAWPNVTVSQGATLIADMTNADYSAGNIVFEDDAVLAELVAPTAGPLTADDLPAGVSIWKAAIDT